MGSQSEAEPTWQELVANHQALQRSNIPEGWILNRELLEKLIGGDDGKISGIDLITTRAAEQAQILTAKELEITELYSAVDLLSKMATGQLSALEVTTAFCKRAAIAQQLTSCLTEIFFKQAMQDAKLLDEHYKTHGKVKGPLHGLPISLKDSFVVDGQYSTVGYVEFLRKPLPTGQSALVNLLQDAGAVLYCKTNIPQTMMTADSENNIFGRTLNPHKTSVTAGGSSGGEGSLVGFRGSPLGVGTDIAGSIRIPSLCCGTYGFKPTANRVPFAGQALTPFPRLHLPSGVLPTAGPIGHSVDDLEAFMRIVLDSNPWNYDQSCFGVPWNTADPAFTTRPLRIGVPPEDNEYTLHPPVRRAWEGAIAQLEKAGHTIIRLPEDESRSIGLGARIAFASYGAGHPGPEKLQQMMKEPFVKSLALGVHPFTKKPPPVPRSADIGEVLSALTTAVDAYAGSWRQAWVEHSLDIVLCPGAQSTAVPHDTFGVPAYTCAWNVLDYPACIIPYGRASASLDPDSAPATAAFDPSYDPEAVDGVPCAVQIITPRFRDEQCLAAAKIVDSILNPARA
ncbi:amidase signature domain-containing protein [Microdochium trichocladiopsis]|uniref:amidase n=1 Tax=Microdochium trichocladiopsis TaxID=1682393 RepID=A0A9P9BQ37_9PEZI|nr:amidase signature domain-containing protein [Microdochium trichocladiopsis]KAH7029877.1 amidase signature domain-containing protein [Microdochium trichocladiopsis]